MPAEYAENAHGVVDGQFPDVDYLRRSVIELPCHQDLTPPEIDRVADETARALAYCN
jgi:dTDP-4-amino-4,6-dideoxygalactose transaminase